MIIVLLYGPHIVMYYLYVYYIVESGITQLNKAVRQRSDLLFIETSFWFEESPCAVRTNTAGLGRLCTLFVLSTLLVFLAHACCFIEHSCSVLHDGNDNALLL